MKFLRLFLLAAAPLPLMLGCWDSSGPTSPPAPPVDSLAGFVPLAVGNTWIYAYSYSWGEGHNNVGSIDSGFRRITISSRADSGGTALYHARIDDSITRQPTWLGNPSRAPELSVTSRTIGFLDGSSRIQLVLGAKDDDGMLAACFGSHAFPADSVHKVPGKAYGVPGLPDTVFAATITKTSPFNVNTGASSITTVFEEARSIGPLAYSVDNGGAFNPNGSITPSSKLIYRLVDFRLSL